MRSRAVIAVLLLAALPASAAVDSATKRASVVNLAGSALPVPSGTIGASNRAHLVMAYSGFAYDGGSGPANPGEGDGSSRLGVKGVRIGL